MRTKRVCVVLCLTALLLSMTSCAQKSEVEKDLAYFCSDEVRGRLPGTDGNLLAGDYIAKQFESQGLNYFKGTNSFFHEFDGTVYNPDNQTQVLEVTFRDGSKQEYKAGVDFPVPISTFGAEINGEITCNPLDLNISTKVFLVEEVDESTPQNARLILRKSNSNYGQVSSLLGTRPQIGLPAKIFESIREYGKTLRLIGQPDFNTAALQNVVGVLDGGAGESAIVIGAHFDHIGWYGDHIFPGALDNASGSAVLLELLRELRGRGFLPQNDIIFCAFNKEEDHLGGSRAFVKSLSGYANVNMLNIDCVGMRGNPAYAVDKQGNDALAKRLSEALQLELESEDFASDQQAFYGQGYAANAIGHPAVTVSEFAHTENDTVTLINSDELKLMAQKLANFVEGLDKEMIPKDEKFVAPLISNKMIQEIMEGAPAEGTRLLNEMEDIYGQILYYPYKGFCFWSSTSWPLTSQEQIQEYYPTLTVPERIGDYTFSALRPARWGAGCLAEDIESLPEEPYLEPDNTMQGDRPINFVLYYKDSSNYYIILVTKVDVIQEQPLTQGERFYPMHEESILTYGDNVTTNEFDKLPYQLFIPPENGKQYSFTISRITNSVDPAVGNSFPMVFLPEAGLSDTELEHLYKAVRTALEPAL